MIRPVRPDGTIETGGVFVPVLRRRVLERLASAAMQRIVLVIAPAGYGKSVALRQFLDSIEEPCVRYDVLPDNGGLLGFLRGFADALNEVAPDARATLAGAYEKNASSDSPGTDLAMWMHAHLKGYRGIIAIDDLHVAQEDREVTRFLSSLIERTKGRVQWVIASRTALGLPIGTWLAYGESDLAIDEHDLKFSIEEARDAARTFKLGVRDEELYELLNLTDGWATAMSFALRSSTRSVDLRNISSMTRDMIYRYLAEQVYQGLDEEERDFLETAALLPEIDVEVLVAAGYQRAVGAIEELRQRVAFIQEAKRGNLYRLHDLFRDFVLYQLRLRGESQLQSRALLLGAVLERTQRVTLALRLYSDSGAYADAIRLLTRHGVDLVARGYADEVAVVVDNLCRARHDADPVVVGVGGLIELARGNTRKGHSLLERAIRDVSDSRLFVSLSMHLAVSLVSCGESPISLLEKLLPDERLERSEVLEVQALLAVCYVYTGAINEAEHALSVVVPDISTVESNDVRARLQLRVGTAYLTLKNEQRAKHALQAAVEHASAQALWSVAAKAYFNLSLCSFFSDIDVTSSLWFAQQAVSSAVRSGENLVLQGALLMMLSLETRRGNIDRSVQIEKQLSELHIDDPQRANYIASSQAHRFAWAGRYSDARRLFGAVLDRQAYAVDRALVRAAYAVCLALDGLSKQSGVVVEQTFEQMSQLTDDGTNSTLLDLATLLLALAEIASGRSTSAARALKRVSDAGNPIVLDMQSAVEDVLRASKNASYTAEAMERSLEAVRDHGFGGYARYAALVADAVIRRREPEAPVSLTPSEARIVRDLAAGLSPKEIAAEMGRSVYTVQTHIQNLIEKLGCHGRAEAIAAARRLGYL